MRRLSQSGPAKGAALSAPFSLRWVETFIARNPAASLAVCAGALVSLAAAIAAISPAFYYGSAPGGPITATFYALMTAAGAAYLFLFFILPHLRGRKILLAGALIVGLAVRALFFGSTPIYEDDWYRYLWDGAMVNAGVNPYSFPPADVFPLTPLSEAPPLDHPRADDILAVASQNDHYPERVAYPYLSTIYPPVAQMFFAIAQKVRPFDLDGWRAVLLGVDMLGVAILLALLVHWRRSPFWALLYWWNPLLAVSAFNAGHMDILLTPFIAGAMLLTALNKPRIAAAALAGAAGVKFWPAMLAPILFRQWRRDPKTLAAIAGVFIAALIVVLGPMIAGLEPRTSGLAAYANDWLRNAFLFPLMTAVFETFSVDGDLYARGAVAMITLGVIAYYALAWRWRVKEPPADISMARHMLIAAAVLFFLSPTGYAWYAAWLFLFLPFAPFFGVGVLTLCLPIYYLRFYFENAGRGDIFNTYLTPIEFGAPLAVIAWTVYRGIRRKTP